MNANTGTLPYFFEGCVRLQQHFCIYFWGAACVMLLFISLCDTCVVWCGVVWFLYWIFEENENSKILKSFNFKCMRFCLFVCSSYKTHYISSISLWKDIELGTWSQWWRWRWWWLNRNPKSVNNNKQN